MIRKLTTDDVQAVYDLLRPFFDEGHWKDYGTFSPEKSIGYIWAFLEAWHPMGYFDDEGLGGLLVVEKSYEFHTEPVAYITNFYIAPRLRGTPAARSLFQEAVNFCEREKTIAVYVASCGIFTTGADKVFGNLVKKFGFKQLSSMYGRF